MSAAGSVAPPAAEVLDPTQPPVRPTPLRPVDDPAYTAVAGTVKATAKQKRSHAPATAKAKEAQDAALPPSNDIGSQAKAAKADTMEAQRPGTFDKKAFIAAVEAAIAAKTPRTLAQADKYKASGKTAEVKGEIKGLVSDGKQGQARAIDEATRAAPDETKALPKPVTPMGPEPAGTLAPVSAAGAVPKRAPAEQLNLAAGPREVDAELAEGEVDEDQLARSNEPQFTGALADKKAAAAHAETAPGAYRAEETQTLQQNKADAQAGTTAGLGGMQGARGAAMAKLVADKGRAKTKDEVKRTEVTTRIDSLFNATEGDVKKILDGIDPLVEKEFNAGEARARTKFESYVGAKMSAYKADRYGGWLGKLRWVRDKIRGMPDKVNEFYVAGRELYLQEMSRTISRVADIVGRELTAAKVRIARGRGEIAKYVESLPKDLKKIGGEASKEIGERFEQLESDVDAKQDALVDDLASKYVAARKGLDERIEELQAENRGLIDKAIGAIKAVINTIRELAAMLRDVLLKVAGAVSQIIRHPIRFLGNLVAGVKGGILAFKEDFFGHLKRGLMRWLFGALAESNIEVPKSFDPQSIIGFLASIFGLTWDNIRKRLARQIGEPAMAAVEKGVDIFTILSGPEGVGGLWQMIMTKIGDVKEMIFESVKDFVKDRIISAGVTFLISLLNPAAAFVKACKMIYDVVMFFVNNRTQIKAFVDTVLDSVTDMVAGNVGAVVAKINDALGRMVPIIIGFLASLVNLGGIGQKIRDLVNRLQKPVTKAVDLLIAQGMKLAGPIIRRVAGVAGKVKAKVLGGDDSPAGREKRLTAGVRSGVAAANRLAGSRVGAKVLSPLLSGIRLRHGLGVLEPVAQGGKWAVHGEVQRMTEPTDVEVAEGGTTGERGSGRRVTAYQGTDGDAILAIIASRTLNPSGGKIFLARSEFGSGFTHGGDSDRGASFVIEVEATIPDFGTSEVRTSTPGVRDTLRIDTTTPLAVDVTALHIRKPVFEDEETPGKPTGRRRPTGYEFETIHGAAAIKEYLLAGVQRPPPTESPPVSPGPGAPGAASMTAAERDWERARAQADGQAPVEGPPVRTEHGAIQEGRRGALSAAEQGRLGQAENRRQGDGAVVRILREGGGTHTVVITNARGDLVTVIRGKDKAELRRLSENYGWDPPYV